MTKISNQYSLTNILTADLANSRLGINNVSPTVALDVTGAGKFSSSVGIGTTTAGNFNGVSFTGPFFDVAGVMQIKGTSANTVSILQFGGDTYRKATIVSSIGTEDPYLAFGTASSGSSSSSSERMRIDSAGNIGIGTSTVTSSAGWTPTLVLNATSAALIIKGINGQENSLGTSNGFYIDCLGNSTASNNNIIFRTSNTNSNFSASERMRITSGGRILCSGDVWGTERFGVVLDSSLASSTGITAYMNNTSYTGSLIRVQAETVGNTSWYGYELRAQGVIKYGIYGNGSVTAPSDERRKKNIETTRDGYLKDLCNLRVVKYNWKDDEEGKDRELGFIAQEVEKIFPKLVETGHDGLNNENEVKLLKQGVLVPILVKAIQELSAKVSLLENK